MIWTHCLASCHTSRMFTAATIAGLLVLQGELGVQQGSPAARAVTSAAFDSSGEASPRPGNPTSTFSCQVQSVTDGDTFRCTNGLRVRLSAIDTPEMPGSCRKGRACVPGNPHAARVSLSRLIDGRTVTCLPVGKSYNRITAWCSIAGVDLSCAMVRSGHAAYLPRYDRRGRLCRR